MKEKEHVAYLDIKSNLVKEMFYFTQKYGAKGSDCLYPECGHILIKALEDCVKEAKAQMGIKE